jgi:RES domain-containing protein
MLPLMQVFWRISNYIDLRGEGGRISSARWHTSGRPIVYLSDSPASAMLERMVHLQDGNGKLPQVYDLLRITAPEDIAIGELLPLADSNWKEAVESTRRLGDAWLASLETPLARVPSVIMPYTWNYLLNPVHPDARQLTIQEVLRERFDNRLFRFGAR